MKGLFKMRHIKFYAIIAFVNVFLICFCDSHQKQEKAEQIKLTQKKTRTIDTIKNKTVQTADTAFGLMKSESIGPAKIGLPGDSLLQYFSQPDSMGPIQMSQASGDYIQNWEYYKIGIKFEMESHDSVGLKRVSSIEVFSPCTLSTKKGIKIGSGLDEVKKEYGEYEDKENSDQKSSFVAGSIYGGVIFSIQDGKVNQIFIGASAE
jgi:hypothetical protein